MLILSQQVKVASHLLPQEISVTGRLHLIHGVPSRALWQGYCTILSAHVCILLNPDPSWLTTEILQPNPPPLQGYN
jgi:hypothetical protein